MNYETLKTEWNARGETYAREINEMVDFIDKNGWEAWENLSKKEAEDTREPLAKEVYRLLKRANEEKRVEAFRADFPPSREPFIEMVKKRGKYIWDMHFLENEKIVFMTGTAYEKRNTYILNKERIEKISEDIRSIGKSQKNNIFAIAYAEKIDIYQWFFGEKIAEFPRNITQWWQTVYEDGSTDFAFPLTKIIPFNDGKKALLVSPRGFYLVSETEERLLPLDLEMIDMENACVSHDNEYIVIGCQDSDFIVFDATWEKIWSIWPQLSSYPHFCIFSQNDAVLAMNSCHFYHGATIVVEEKDLTETIGAWDETSEKYRIIDEEMRVYSWVAAEKYFIFWDAYGSIRAIDEQWNHLWKHYLGSSISGIALSHDEKTLWVWSHSGILHTLKLWEWQDAHTIGNGNHREERRYIFWDEDTILKW